MSVLKLNHVSKRRDKAMNAKMIRINQDLGCNVEWLGYNELTTHIKCFISKFYSVDPVHMCCFSFCLRINDDVSVTLWGDLELTKDTGMNLILFRSPMVNTRPVVWYQRKWIWLSRLSNFIITKKQSWERMTNVLLAWIVKHQGNQNRNRTNVDPESSNSPNSSLYNARHILKSLGKSVHMFSRIVANRQPPAILVKSLQFISR